jgi:CrcB protein
VPAAVALGGAVGTLGRYALEARFAPADPAGFPVVTLGINIAGALVLGAVITLILEVWPPTRLLRPFLAIGVLGAFTTMATFSLEAVRMLEAGAVVGALAYAGCSLAGGVGAVLLGAAGARALPVLRRRARR